MRLDAMNDEIEQLYKDGRDLDARNLESRADALARRMFREVPVSAEESAAMQAEMDRWEAHEELGNWRTG